MFTKKALVSIFSDGTNTDLDFSKVLTAAAFMVFLAISLWIYIKKDVEFDPMLWTGAVSVLIATGGGVSKIRDFSGTAVLPMNTTTTETKKVTVEKPAE